MKIKHIIRIIIFVILAAALVAFATVFLSVPYERDSMGTYGFYKEPENSIDVVFIGPSEVYTSFYSPLAYEQQGFTSYSLAVSSMNGSAYKSAVQVAESRQNPELYIVELWGFNYGDKFNEVSTRKWLDTLPPSSIRTEAIKELVSEDEQDSYNFRLLKYHSNWTSLKGCFEVFKDKIHINSIGYSVTKNFSTTYNVAKYEEKNQKYKIPEQGMKYLEEFLEFCQSDNIENVLFVRTPEMYNYEVDESYYEALDKIQAAGYDFLNMEELSDEIGIDVNNDFFNTTHLNIFGAEKYTAYLSEYVMENYDIDTEHSEDVKKEWDYCASFNDSFISRTEKLTLDKKGGYHYTQKDLLGE